MWNTALTRDTPICPLSVIYTSMPNGERISFWSRDKHACTETKELPENWEVPTSESLGSNPMPVPEFYEQTPVVPAGGDVTNRSPDPVTPGPKKGNYTKPLGHPL